MTINFTSGIFVGLFLAYAVPIVIARLLRGRFRIRRRYGLPPLSDEEIIGIGA